MVSKQEVSGIDPSLNFDNFAVAASNRFAHAAGIAITDVSGAAPYSPALIYGGSGLGKTHLLNAIGNRVIDSDSDVIVRYLSADEWRRRFVDALQGRQIAELISRVRRVSVLLIDNVEILQPMKRIQEEFFRFVEAIAGQTSVVLAASTRPAGHVDQLPGLRSSRALITTIDPPEEGLIVKVVQRRADEMGVTVPVEVTTFVADVAGESVGHAIGALLSVIAYAHATGREIDKDVALEALSR